MHRIISVFSLILSLGVAFCGASLHADEGKLWPAPLEIAGQRKPLLIRVGTYEHFKSPNGVSSLHMNGKSLLSEKVAGASFTAISNADELEFKGMDGATAIEIPKLLLPAAKSAVLDGTKVTLTVNEEVEKITLDGKPLELSGNTATINDVTAVWLRLPHSLVLSGKTRKIDRAYDLTFPAKKNTESSVTKKKDEETSASSFSFLNFEILPTYLTQGSGQEVYTVRANYSPHYELSKNFKVRLALGGAPLKGAGGGYFASLNYMAFFEGMLNSGWGLAVGGGGETWLDAGGTGIAVIGRLQYNQKIPLFGPFSLDRIIAGVQYMTLTLATTQVTLGVGFTF